MKPNSGENLKRAPRAIDICGNLVTGADRVTLRPFETVIRSHEIGVPGEHTSDAGQWQRRAYNQRHYTRTDRIKKAGFHTKIPELLEG
ncbi:hypothetical protein [Asaia spathodeae]|uniref:hypothetical protein n=1 Tax=Asaia spathodeae TaxID=657016 RepID=UPI002FC32141